MKTLQWGEIILDYPDPDLFTWVLKIGEYLLALLRKKNCWGDASLLPLKVEEGPTILGKQATPRSWKGQGNEWSPKSLHEGTTA